MNTFVIDSNVLISALVRDGFVRSMLTDFGMNYIFPEYGVEEIYKYKKLIMKKSGMNTKEFDIILLRLLKYVKLVPLDMATEFEKEAFEIIGHIDEKDVVFVAMALVFDCGIWSDDKHFQKQKRVGVFTTKEIYKEFRNETN